MRLQLCHKLHKADDNFTQMARTFLQIAERRQKSNQYSSTAGSRTLRKTTNPSRSYSSTALALSPSGIIDFGDFTKFLCRQKNTCGKCVFIIVAILYFLFVLAVAIN